MKKTTVLAIVAVIILLGGLAYYTHRTPSSSAVPAESISSSQAPWAPELTHLKERLTALGLPALSAEGTALHTHQHLDLIVHGKAVEVPAEIGVHDAFPTFISPIHTHDTTGIIHVESPTVQKFTLGQFFDIWGVRLTDTCLGGYCSDATNTLAFYVKGAPYTGDPRAIELTEHEEVAVVYGTASEMPTSTPSTYSFPEGY
ncbi:MAG: hypothetical protein JWO84_770 [Parcubacteria group bacterium]|nr:hypothetical protein [Parcubacteria group bacterium]